MRLLQPYISKFFKGQVSTLSILEFVQPLLNSQVCYFDNVNYLPNRTAEIVHAGCENQCGAIYTRWSTALDHPIAGHTLDDTEGIVGDLSLFTAEVEVLCEAVDVDCRIYVWKVGVAE